MSYRSTTESRDCTVWFKSFVRCECYFRVLNAQPESRTLCCCMFNMCEVYFNPSFVIRAPVCLLKSCTRKSISKTPKGKKQRDLKPGAGRGQAGLLLPTPRTAEAKPSHGGLQLCRSLQRQLPLSYHEVTNFMAAHTVLVLLSYSMV